MSNLSELLIQLKNVPDGMLDLANIPTDEIVELFDALHSLFRFQNGLTLNKNLTASLSADELEGLKRIQKEFNEALILGRVTFRRNASGRIGSSLGTR